MKFIVRTIVLLLIVNGVLLYQHYNDAGNATAKSSTQLTYSQEIEVMNRPNGLYIRHHFNDLSDGRHEIVWPENSTKQSCYLEDLTTCTRLNESLTAFVEGDADRQSIMYVIPKNKVMTESMLFEDVFAKLDSSIPMSTLFHLTDEMEIGGFWVNGLKQIGNKKMDLIDYSLYIGDGELQDLYWQSEVLPIVYKGDMLTVYSSKETLDIEQFDAADAALKNSNAPHATVIIDSSNKQVTSSRFVVLNSDEVDGIVDTIIVNTMYEQFSIPQEERLIAEVVASLQSRKAVGSEKSRKVFEALDANLTTKELELINERLHSKNRKSVNAAWMDKAIEETTGLKTSFITKNNNDNVHVYPFLLEEPRKVFINGKENSDVSLLLKEGKALYPITEIMQGLGYTVSFNEQSLYIEDYVRKIRFPLRDKFYVYNERRYNVNAIPFERIGNEFYFEEPTFIRIFLVEIRKTDELVDIRPMALFTEEAQVK